MLLMTTLGSSFKKIWEAGEGKIAYFSGEYGDQRTVFERILRDFPIKTGRYAIGRYVEFHKCGPTQDYGPSILAIEDIGYLEQRIKISGKEYDIGVKFSFIKKINNDSLLPIINNYRKFPLLYSVYDKDINTFVELQAHSNSVEE